jgi:hypothetical protein
MLADADPIRIAHGRLQLPSIPASNALVDAIARSGGNLGQLGQRGISIPARMKDGRPCVTHVLPIGGGEAHGGLSSVLLQLSLLLTPNVPRKCPLRLWH